MHTATVRTGPPILLDRKQWVVTQFSFLSGYIARQPSRATTLNQSQSQSQSLPPLSQQADVESDSSYAGEVPLIQASRALAHNTCDDAAAGPSGIATTPVGRPEDVSPPSTNTSQKRRRVTHQPSDAVERLLAKHTEKQRVETELRTRLLNPDKRQKCCDYIAASVKDR